MRSRRRAVHRVVKRVGAARHQAARGDRRIRPGALAADLQDRVPADPRRCGSGARGAPPVCAATRREGRGRGRPGRRARRGIAGCPRRRGPQATRPRDARRLLGWLTEVTAGGRTTRTVAAESPDPAAVVTAVEHLGLTGYVNQSYPRGLIDLLDDRLPRFAVIDVGTNSVKFHIGERGADGTWRPSWTGPRLLDWAKVSTKPERSRKPRSSEPRTPIAAMAAEARADDVSAIAAVGTAVFRIASNGDEAVATIRDRAGVSSRSCPATKRAASPIWPPARPFPSGGTTVVFDTGGGSSQFTFGHQGAIDDQFSVNVGAVAMTEQFGLAGRFDRWSPMRRRRSARALLRSRWADPARSRGGHGRRRDEHDCRAKSLAQYDPGSGPGSDVDAEEIDRQIELYRTRCRRTTIDRRAAAQACRGDPGRRVRRPTILDKLDAASFTVSDRGLRHGVLIERMAHETDPENQFARRRLYRATISSGADEADAGSRQRRAEGDSPCSSAPSDDPGLCRSIRSRRSRARSSSSTPRIWPCTTRVSWCARDAIAGGKGDTVVKLRPVVPDELPARAAPRCGIQRRGRRAARRFRLLGAHSRAERPARRSRERRRRAPAKIYSKEQRAFFKAHAPDGARPRRAGPARPDVPAEGRCSSQPEQATPTLSSPRCGSIRTARESSSCRPSASRPRRSRPRPNRGNTSRSRASLTRRQETKTRTALRFLPKRSSSGPLRVAAKNTRSASAGRATVTRRAPATARAAAASAAPRPRKRPPRRRSKRRTGRRKTTRAPRKTTAKPAQVSARLLPDPVSRARRPR